MTRNPLRLLLLGAVGALLAGPTSACSSQPSPVHAPAPSPGGHPRLVVLLVIDQLPSWSFAAREHLMSRGIGRLLREGQVFPRARYPYAATYTAAGHAALGTGAPPALTGIVNNEWWDREQHAMVEAITDAGHPVLVVDGRPGELAAARTGASPSRLRVPGMGDALHAATGGAGKAVGVSFKNRAAILPLGRAGDLAVWYDDGQRAFTTSTWYARSLPTWLPRLAHEHPIAPRLGDPWQASDAALLARETGIPDDAPGEASNIAFGRTFPHLPRALPDPASAIKMSPLGATVVREAALAAVDGEGLGTDDIPDFLSVSFSNHDYVGHSYGQESWEALDTLLRIDAEIGELLDGLEARVGKGRVAVVLTSDHGAPRMPERMAAGKGLPPIRVEVEDVRSAAERAVAAVAGPGPWLDSWREPSLYFSARFLALPAGTRERALEAAAAAVRGVDGIGYAYLRDRVGPAGGDCERRPDAEAMVCRATDRERSGEILFGPRPGSQIFDKDKDPVAHGSANDEDTLVPVIVWGPGIAAGRHSDVVSTLQVCPTIARLLGVPAPAAASAPPLPLPPPR
jgi:type I phosphodiesterase/nucleotide pyrophosphatase